MSTELWATIITVLLTVVGGVFGLGKYIKGFMSAVSESFDVVRILSDISNMLEKILSDNVVSKDEITALKKEAKKIKVEVDQAKIAWKELFKKKS